MNEIEHFKIHLINEIALYRSGDQILGSVIIKLNRRFKVNSLNINLIGYAKTFWNGSLTTDEPFSSVTYSDQVAYLNDDYLIASKKSNTDLYLEVGEYTFPFEFNLPDDLPTSFEHDAGRIRYTLKGVIDTPHSFKRFVLKSITIINEINLNEYKLSKPRQVKDSAGGFLGDRVYAVFSINKSGFVPGEQIVCNAEIENNTLKVITKCSIKLVQKIKFTGSRKKLIKLKKVKHFNVDLVIITNDKKIAKKTSNFVFENTPFQIPKVCPSSNGMCKLIEIEYFVVFEFSVDGSPVDKQLEIPIKIITKPFDADKALFKRLYSYEECSSEKIVPFSYHEQLDGEIYNSDETTFKPTYPYFNKI